MDKRRAEAKGRGRDAKSCSPIDDDLATLDLPYNGF